MCRPSWSRASRCWRRSVGGPTPGLAVGRWRRSRAPERRVAHGDPGQSARSELGPCGADEVHASAAGPASRSRLNSCVREPSAFARLGLWDAPTRSFRLGHGSGGGSKATHRAGRRCSRGGRCTARLASARRLCPPCVTVEARYPPHRTHTASTLLDTLPYPLDEPPQVYSAPIEPSALL